MTRIRASFIPTKPKISNRIAMKKKSLFVVFFSAFAAMIAMGAISPLLPDFIRSFHITGFWVGLIFAGYAISRFLVMPLAGKLSDIRGRKMFIVGGLLLMTGVSLSFLKAASGFDLMLIRLAQGVAAGVITPIITAYAGGFTKSGEESRSMGMFYMMMYFAVACGPLIGGFVRVHYGINAVFYTMAIISGFAFLLALFFLAETDRKQAREPAENTSFSFIIRRYVIRAVLIVAFTMAVRVSAIMAFLPPLASNLGLNPFHIGAIIFFSIFFMAVLQPFFGYTADMADKPGKLYHIPVGSIIGTAGIFLFPFCKDFSTLVIAGIVVGVGGAIALPAASGISVLVGQRVGMGSWMGIFNSAVSAGTMIGALLGGFVMGKFGVSQIFYVTGVISLIGTAFCLYYVLLRVKGVKEGCP